MGLLRPVQHPGVVAPYGGVHGTPTMFDTLRTRKELRSWVFGRKGNAASNNGSLLMISKLFLRRLGTGDFHACSGV